MRFLENQPLLFPFSFSFSGSGVGGWGDESDTGRGEATVPIRVGSGGTGGTSDVDVSIDGPSEGVDEEGLGDRSDGDLFGSCRSTVVVDNEGTLLIVLNKRVLRPEGVSDVCC